MSQLKPWVEGLQIAPGEATHWQNQLPKGEDFTFWCLKSKKLKAENYFVWARSHYNLPIVQSQFFSQEMDLTWWVSFREIANWSSHMLPLYQWDGVVYIGCVEPIEDVQWSFPVKYVLAQPEDLEFRWEQLLEASAKVDRKKVEDPSEVAAPIKVNDEQTLTETKVQLETPTDSSETPAADVPEGMTLQTPSAKPAAEVPEGMAQPVTEAPEGMTLQTPAAKPAAEVPEGMAQPAAEVPEGIAQPAAASGTAEAPAGLSLVTTKPLVDQPQNAPSADSPPPATETAEAPNDPANPKGVYTQKIKPLSSTLDQDTIDAFKEKYENTNEDIERIFEEFHKQFHSVMILMTEGENISPWMHDGTWNPRTKEAGEPFNISEPCIFRIVQKSGQPFHGSIAKNPTNDVFFKNWGYAKIPEHVTLIPIKYDSHAIGMVMAIAGKEASPVEALQFAEARVEQLKGHIQKLSSAA